MTRGGYAVAADGFHLLAVPCTFQEAADESHLQKGVIIPSGFYAMAHAFAPRKAREVRFAVDSPTVAAETRHGQLFESLIDGEYPNWKALIPPRKEPEHGPFYSYDTGYLTKLVKAFGNSKVVVYGAQSSSPFIVAELNGEAFGVVMPLFVTGDAAMERLERIVALSTLKGEAPGEETGEEPQAATA